MQIANIKVVKKVIGLFEIFFCFGREANDHVNTNAAMWHNLFDLLDSFRVKLPAITPAHSRQYLIAPALQRNMEMRHEFFTSCNEIDYIRSQQIRFNRRYPVTIYTVYFIKGLN